MIYTSYFGKLNKLKELGLTPVSITAGQPKFFQGEHFDEVAPLRVLVHDYKSGLISESQYEKIYDMYLEYNKETILDIVKEKYLDKNVVFLCYEKTGTFCHRHLLARFLRNNGIDCEEICLI